MRLATLKIAASKNIFNSEALTNKALSAGVLKETTKVLSSAKNINRTRCISNSLQRQMSSDGGTTKRDSTSGELFSQFSSTNFQTTKPIKTSYKAVNLSYISYEKKEKVSYNFFNALVASNAS